MTESARPKLVCVCGTTASGKSDLSILLAQHLQTEIICFDSAQVFKFADIGSAKVDKLDQAKVRHHLIDIYEPDQKLQAGAFIQLANLEIDKLIRKSKIPLLCIGTSLYFRLLLEGLADTGEADLTVRNQLEQLPTHELYQQLVNSDPQRATQLHFNDRLRIIRALEIFLTQGKTATELYSEQKKQSDYDVLLLILVRNKQSLSERIELRTKKMLKAGLIEESRFLLQKYGRDIQIFDSIGYQESLQYLESQNSPAPMSLSELEDRISLHTRQLAKRQLTFWRSYPAKSGFILDPQQNFPEHQHNQEKLIKTRKSDFGDIKLEIDSFMKCPSSRAVYLELI